MKDTIQYYLAHLPKGDLMIMLGKIMHLCYRDRLSDMKGELDFYLAKAKEFYKDYPPPVKK